VATQLVATVINDPCLTAGDVEIVSMAPVIETWKKWQTKVATLSFRQTPALQLSRSAASAD
jgi:hypothetical protein